MSALSQVVEKEAAKLLRLAVGQEALLSEDSLKLLEILCRCSKALKNDAPSADDPPAPGDATVEGDLKLVTGGG